MSTYKKENEIGFAVRWKITWKILLHCVQNISKAFVYLCVPRQCSEYDANQSLISISNDSFKEVFQFEQPKAGITVSFSTLLC